MTPKRAFLVICHFSKYITSLPTSRVDECARTRQNCLITATFDGKMKFICNQTKAVNFIFHIANSSQLASLAYHIMFNEKSTDLQTPNTQTKPLHIVLIHTRCIMMNTLASAWLKPKYLENGDNNCS